MVDLTLDNENVSFKGKSIEVTTRQAKLVRLLARPRPAPVATSFLIGALWDGKPPQTAQKQIEEMTLDLQKPLKGIGLDLKLVKGVGYQLKDL
jgi:DNA-binding response OmpR family regulator